MRTSLLLPVCRNVSAAFLVLATLLLAATGGTVSLAQEPAKGPTVWDGVYTDAQAARATSVFGASCSNCHSLAPDGTGNRPLAGERFWQRNTQKSVGELLAFVSKNMPNGAAAGSLAPATYNDLVALILKSNGLPAGMAELTPDTAAGAQIIPKDGPGELPANTLVRVVGCLARNGTEWVLTSATAPARAEGAKADDEATRPLGDRTLALKFVLTRLDANLGKRMAVSGMLMGAGGTDGINVTTVTKVAETCP
jgi:mono/diheme cytochrome c family protein